MIWHFCFSKKSYYCLFLRHFPLVFYKRRFVFKTGFEQKLIYGFHHMGYIGCRFARRLDLDLGFVLTYSCWFNHVGAIGYLFGELQN